MMCGDRHMADGKAPVRVDKAGCTSGLVLVQLAVSVLVTEESVPSASTTFIEALVVTGASASPALQFEAPLLRMGGVVWCMWGLGRDK
jgi:hypothetical protein